MNSLRRRVLLGAFRMADIAVMGMAFATAFIFVAQQQSSNRLGEFLSARIKLSNVLLLLAFAGAWHLIFRSYRLYRSRRIGQLGAEWWDVTKATVLGILVLAALALLLDLTAMTRWFLMVFSATALLGTLVMRAVLRLLLRDVRRNGRNLRSVIIVGCGQRGAALGRELWSRPELGYLLLGYVDDAPPPPNPLHGGPDKLLGSLEQTETLVTTLDVDEVFIALPVRSHYDTIARLVARFKELGLIVRIPIDLFPFQFAQFNIDYLDDTALLTLNSAGPRSLDLVSKRVVDIAGSALALVGLSPLLVLVAVVIKLESRGPIVFSQERVGFRCRKFRIIKFRTMVDGAEARLKDLEQHNEVDGAAFKMKNDPRITGVGRFLRKFSLDELPQLWNVLSGDMSLVGPRPLPPRDVDRFDASWQKRRFSVKPGLTCLWQTNGRHEIGFDHWMELDLQYIDNWSLKLDFDIMWKTLPAVLRGTGG